MPSRWNRGVGYRIIVCMKCQNPAGGKGEAPLKSVGTKKAPRYVHDGPCPPRCRSERVETPLVVAQPRVNIPVEDKSPGGLILPGGRE